MYKVKVLRSDMKSFYIEVPDVNDLECWVISYIGTWLSLEYAEVLKQIVLRDKSFNDVNILSIY